MSASVKLALIAASTAALFTFPQDQEKSTTSVQPISIVGLSRVQYPTTAKRKGFIVAIEPDFDTSKDVEPVDFMVLRLESTDGEQYAEPATLKFESTYGKLDLCLVDLTGDGVEEFVLITGENRGTSVREERLRVYQRRGSKFAEILSTPQSSFFGGGTQWRYRPQYSDIDADGIIDLVMTLEHDPIDSSNSMQDPTLIPKVRRKTFIYDPRSKRMKLFVRK